MVKVRPRGWGAEMEAVQITDATFEGPSPCLEQWPNVICDRQLCRARIPGTMNGGGPEFAHLRDWIVRDEVGSLRVYGDDFFRTAFEFIGVGGGAMPVAPAPAAETRASKANPQVSNQIENAFTYHRPTAEAGLEIAGLRAMARELARAINELVPDGREKATALTNLEQVCMWANAGIARQFPASDRGAETKTLEELLKAPAGTILLGENGKATYLERT